MNIDIEKIKRRLLIKYPHFGSIVANSTFSQELSIKTAATDGENIYYNPNFISRLNEEEQIFIFAHEICHIAFNHIFRSEGKNKKLWNIATDSVINAFLKDDGLPLIKGGVNIPEAINYDAEEMYQKLIKEQQNNQNKSENNEQNQSSSNYDNLSDNEKLNDSKSQFSENNASSETTEKNNSDEELENNQDVGHDTHNLWDKAIKRKKEEQTQPESQNQTNSLNKEQKKEKSSLLERILNKNKESKLEEDKEVKENQQVKKEEKQKKKEEIKKITSLGEKKTFEQNKIERKKQLEELRQSLAEQSYGAGKVTNREVRKVNNIGVSSPLIDWRILLKEAVKFDIDWSYQNASIENGVITPYLEEIPQPETEIILDTSGSINETLLRNFLRECKNILQTSKVKVGCFDTEFYGFNEIRNESDIDNMAFVGGGGTNFDAAVNAFTRRVENKIIFTDGYADMPNKPLDAIWIVFGDRKISPKGGKVINIDEEQLQKLYFLSNNELKRKTR